MKKLAIALFVSLGLMTAHAKGPVKESLSPSTLHSKVADSTQYTGKFRYEGLPFVHMEISLKETKLYFSGGEYSGFLTAIKDQKDVFDANGQAVFTFRRNDAGKVVELQIDYQGETYIGQKEN